MHCYCRGTARVIFAFGVDKPVDGIPAKHEQAHRGTRSIDLIQGPVPAAPLPADVQTLDMVFDNVTIPSGRNTRYWWRAMKWPTSNKVRRVAGRRLSLSIVAGRATLCAPSQ